MSPCITQSPRHLKIYTLVYKVLQSAGYRLKLSSNVHKNAVKGVRRTKLCQFLGHPVCNDEPYRRDYRLDFVDIITWLLTTKELLMGYKLTSA